MATTADPMSYTQICRLTVIRPPAAARHLASQHPCVTALVLTQGTLDGLLSAPHCVALTNCLLDIKVAENAE